MLRRALRHAFTALSALSLLLCAAVCVLWVRSYWVAERANFYGMSDWVGVMSSRGSLIVEHISQATIAEDANWFMLNRWHPSEVRRLDPRGLAPVAYEAARNPAEKSTVSLSYWLVSLLLLTPAVVKNHRTLRRMLRAYRQWRLPTPGLCAACGYDLRASPERCPECGTPAQNAV